MNVPLVVVAVVYLSLFLNFFLVASFDSLSPRMTEEHGLSPSQLSIILSIKSFVNMAAGPILALMSSKIPLLFMFTACSCSIAIAYTGVAFASTMVGFAIARAFHGIGTSGLVIGGMSVLMNCVPKKLRGRYSSIAYSAAGHAPLVAPVLSGLLYGAWGQVWAFLIPAFVTLAVTLGSFLVLRKALAIPVLHESRSEITTIDKSDMWPCVVKIFNNPMSFIALAGIFSEGFSFGCCESTLPQILTDWVSPETGQRLSVLTTCLIYSVGPLTFTVVAPLVGFLVDRIGHYCVLLLGIGLYVCFFPAFHVLDQTLVGLGACIAIAFGVSVLPEVSIYPFIAEIVEHTGIPNAQGIGYALNEMFIQAGFALGNVAGRQLLDWNGMLAMGLFVAAWDALVLVISLAILILIYRKRKQSVPKEELVLNDVKISFEL